MLDKELIHRKLSLSFLSAVIVGKIMKHISGRLQIYVNKVSKSKMTIMTKMMSSVYTIIFVS